MTPQGATVYILESEHPHGQRYVGFTRLPIHVRLARHNAGDVPSTSRHRPWRLITAIWLPDPKRALALERYLKTGSGRAFAKRHL
ncbi:MAG: GIY-YIG nuclease family protein [Planctomycetota bacterium]